MRPLRSTVIALLALAAGCGGSPAPASSTAPRPVVALETAPPAVIAPREADPAPTPRNDEGPAAPEVPADDVARVRIEIPAIAPRRGPDTALVTMVVFSDFQCPFCSRMAAVVDELTAHYGDRLRVVWRDRPLPFHRDAEGAAMAAREAMAQLGPAGFWRMHDVLFANQRALSRADLDRYAAQLGLDAARFAAAMDEGRHLATVRSENAAAEAIGVSGTPTSFINGRAVVGALPASDFVAVIDDELARSAALVASGVAPSAVYETRMRGAAPRLLREAPRPRADRAPRLDPAAVYRVPITGAPATGADDALVTIVVFSDFECPFCARAVPTMARLRARYGRELRIVFRHNPLPFHEHAQLAAEAAMEAYAQGGDAAFWQMHDRLFAEDAELDRASLERMARALRLDGARFERALDEHVHRARVASDAELARSIGVSGTPYFFVNGRMIQGAQPVEEFERVIDEELTRARATLAGGTPRSRIYEDVLQRGSTSPVYLPRDDAR